MTLRLLACALIFVGLVGCEAPYKKKDDEEKKPMKDQSGDQSFQSFIGRVRIAAAKHDTAMLSTLMTNDFGYRWDDGPPGEDAFLYWDQHHLWGQLSDILKKKFGPHDLYMVAPPEAVSDSNYAGYRIGARAVRGSWKLAYFVPAPPAGTQPQ